MDTGEEAQFLLQFGRRIRTLRKERGFSQDQLALECNLTQTYLSQIERGERNASVLTIRTLAKAMDVTPAHLLEGME